MASIRATCKQHMTAVNIFGSLRCMKRGRSGRLAASFVVTATASTTLACGKKPAVDPDPEPSGPGTAYVFKNGAHCSMGEPPPRCPKGVSCNPPAPIEIDCPPSHRDAGEVDPSPARPPGKEDWLRARPHLWVTHSGCSYTAAFFCAPPGKPYECARPTPGFQTLKCVRVDGDASSPAPAAGPRWRVEPFVVKDASGACRAIPAFECGGGECIDAMPEGQPATCPP